MKKSKIVVKEGTNKQRIDAYLSHTLNRPRQQVQKWIKNDLVFVNASLAKAKYIVKENDVIEYEQIKIAPITLKKQKLNLDIVFEDKDIIVINKTNNLVVYPGIGHPENTLLNGVYYHCGQLANVGGELRPGVVHRIDKKTTGLIVFAKTNQAYHNLVKQFATKQAKRFYWALVEGTLIHKKGVIDAPIGRSNNDRKKMAVTNVNGKKAITHFEVMTFFKNHSLLQVRLETGRTHQIRVHMQYINHPLLGDEVYGFKKKKDFFGQYLHAKKLEFIHPITKKPIKLECELPQKFQEKLAELASD